MFYILTFEALFLLHNKWVIWIFAISRHYRGSNAAAVNQASSTDPLTTTTNGTSTTTTPAGVSSTGNLILTGGKCYWKHSSKHY